MNQFFYIFLVAIVLPFTGIAQPVTPAEDLDYILEEFTLPGGRLGNNVQSIVQGPYGFMWFAAHGGLHRYDGHDFVTYGKLPTDSTQDETTLNYKWIETLFWDSDSMLWVGTWGGGLYRYNPVTGNFRHFQFKDNSDIAYSTAQVSCAVENKNGKIWFGTTNGLYLYNKDTDSFKGYFHDPSDPSSLFDDQIRSLYIDRKGTLWIGMGWAWFERGTGTMGKYIPETNSFKNFNHKADQDSSKGIYAVKGILEDREDNFWLGTTKGLYRMNVQDESFELMPKNADFPYAPGMHENPDPAVYSMLEDSKGGIWIGTIGNPTHPSHLLRFDPGSREAVEFPLQGAAWDLFQSDDGTIWVAGSGMSGNIYKVIPAVNSYDLLRSISEWHDLAEQSFYKDLAKNSQPNGGASGGIAIDSKNGNYWRNFCLFTPTQAFALLTEYNPGTQETTFHPLHSLQLDRNTSLFSVPNGNTLLMDGNGVLWGTFSSPDVGIYRYDPEIRKVTEYKAEESDTSTLSSNEIVDMLLDKKGRIWAATTDGILNQLDPESGRSKKYKFSAESESAGDQPLTIMEDNKGNIWVAGNLSVNGFSYIMVIDPETNGEKRIILPDQGVHRTIKNLTKSPDFSKIKFSIENDGIASYNVQNDEFSFYGKKYGFPIDNVADIVCDNSGIWWMADADDSRFLRLINLNNSYIFNEYGSSGSYRGSGYLGPDGHVYFSTHGGWFDIDPDQIDPDDIVGSSTVSLVDLYTFGEKQQPGANSLLEKPLWMMEKITLPSNVETFGFSFSIFNFLHDENKVQYRLIPYEKSWRKGEDSDLANYYRVPPGTYTFQVISSKPGTERGLSRAEIQVNILPPWYFTWWAYTLYGIIFIGGVIVIDRFQRRRLLQKAHTEAREKELEQAREIEKAYTELKTTQTQLVHSEKMASLGELTAGIAHEIQNPLNFVNNFSDVNKELLEELKEEVKNGKRQEAEAIIKDIEENEEKILHHGQRADSIVKGMLQHSRAGGGEKESTDINALCDEYLRLAYHGLRAKDKSFNADFKTELDPDLPKVSVVPQDIGRVLLNLINNAFHAVSQKSEGEARSEDNKPTVILSTTYNPPYQGGTKGGVQISIKDNGPGIPDSIKDKIFQPFFTTKSTGQGTGLGLSMSYDIVTKGHGGELLVESKKGQGTEFTVVLPISG